MGTIADAKFTHNYNCYNGYFIGCLLLKRDRVLSKTPRRFKKTSWRSDYDYSFIIPHIIPTL